MTARALPLALLAAALVAFAARAQDPKKDEPKKDVPKEVAKEPAKQPAPAPADGPAMQKFKQAEAAYKAAREEAYKELVEAEKAARAALDKAQKDLSKAGADKDARAKAREQMTKAQEELMRATTAKFHLSTPVLGPVIASLPPPREETRFGVRFARPSELIATHLNLEKDRGLVIERVDKGQAGEKAGLKAHDVLVEVNGKPVPSELESFRKLLAEIKADAAVPVVVLRQGKRETIAEVKLPAAQPGRN
ncbi:MAG: PDZ domain-containing protein [Planctomycetes bacterium]|nr:PDZ domain-containing protein [Planctomycetota bacterium]